LPRKPEERETTMAETAQPKMDESERKLIKDKIAQARRELTELSKALGADALYGMDFYAGQAASTLLSIRAATGYMYARDVERQYPSESAAAKDTYVGVDGQRYPMRPEGLQEA
jgi:hypothetical protein